MRTIVAFGALLGVAILLAAPLSADIVVLNNGQVFLGKVSSTPTGRIKLSTEYGEQFFAKDQVAGYWVLAQGMEAETFYQAGVLVLGKGQQDAARQLFESCIKYDPNYREKCIAALTKAATPAPVATAPPVGRTLDAGPASQATTVRVQCPQCTGTGQVVATSRLNAERGTQRMRPCPLCGGKGFKDLEIPPEYELCSECAGFGATMDTSGGGGGDRTSGFTSKKNMCPRCAGRGIVKLAFGAADQTSGTGAPGVSVSYSPAPGSAPPTGVYNIARDRAKAVASGRQPERPIGPSGIRPVSPTIIENPPPAQTSGSGQAAAPSGKAEEIVEDPSGSSSGGSSGESAKESKSEEKPEVSSDYSGTGVMGWITRNKKYIIIGGAAALILAVVFSKMSAKKRR